MKEAIKGMKKLWKPSICSLFFGFIIA